MNPALDRTYEWAYIVVSKFLMDRSGGELTAEVAEAMVIIGQGLEVAERTGESTEW